MSCVLPVTSTKCSDVILFIDGKEVVILEAALLIDAGWNSLVHEVWTSVIPPAEVIYKSRNYKKIHL